MIGLEQVEAMIKERLPDAQIVIRDIKGGGDHLEALVVSAEFEGKTRVKQHQLVYSALQEALDSEAIHALALKTYTPQTWETAQSVV
ncbi:MAG: BolA family protein [cyanobacterium endosymbiont of Rhopalodia musculus]|uniref:BolA family protein n=1 Tax=cyanobacterium endosymbiont of Epithemia clementina EcSB TaxID=3034674 RepID=UPI00248127C7|nr:BolA family transcriptional regulator [cyanobacterium endosymbiont of Epithemia clementina EcSB]WGT66926.1 BolA family transcriptional regulator [cyanobacterium endosymbiont of Epithemia clementina EcSB]